MDLIEFVVTDAPAEPVLPLPSRLATLATPDVGVGTPRRTFRFNSMMMSHTINGRSFELERVDERVPLGETEVWTFVNEGAVPHPVHAHGAQFRVLLRAGGRFVFPGLFLLHCHNLEHEDAGMMLNFEVEG